MDCTLRGLDYCQCYIDDILIASPNLETHRLHLHEVFQQLKNNGLFINAAKCVFGKKEVDYLSFIINIQDTKSLTTRVEAVNNMSKPKDINGLRHFLGIINFYRCTPNAANIQALLHEYLISKRNIKKRDKHPVIWNERSEKALLECKQQLANAVLIVHPRKQATLVKSSDAFDTQMGAVLEQYHQGWWEPLGFLSKKFSPAQRKYSTYDRELQAVYSSHKFFSGTIFNGRRLKTYNENKP